MPFRNDERSCASRSSAWMQSSKVMFQLLVQSCSCADMITAAGAVRRCDEGLRPVGVVEPVEYRALRPPRSVRDAAGAARGMRDGAQRDANRLGTCPRNPRAAQPLSPGRRPVRRRQCGGWVGAKFAASERSTLDHDEDSSTGRLDSALAPFAGLGLASVARRRVGALGAAGCLGLG